MDRKYSLPTTVNEVFQDHRGRRHGMLRALTTEKKRFHQLCDPDYDNLSLYSYPDGTWEVSKPAEEIPSELPEPCLGINYARDSMTFQEWLSLVAAHSDAWLFAMAFFHSLKFNKQQRADLFDMMNGFPTLFEVVTGQGSAKQNGDSRGGTNTTKLDIRREEADEEFADEEEDGEAKDENEDEEEEEEAYCGACQGSYSSSSSQFWILCDVCNRWYHGKCVKITSVKAQQIHKYRCPSCTKKRPHP